MDRYTYYIVRVKKPHKKFATGDILIGDKRDGMAERLVCWGWSNKLHVYIKGYSMRYQGWNDWYDSRDEWHYRTTGNGHITIVGKFEASSIELLDEASVKSYAEFIQQLSLFDGNVLEKVEAVATHPRDI